MEYDRKRSREKMGRYCPDAIKMAKQRAVKKNE